MIFKTAVILIIGVAITTLFRQANGGLSPRRLTLVSCTYYVYFIMVYVGCSLTYLGLTNEHYIIKRLTPDEVSLTYWVCSFSGIALGLLCLLWSRVFGIYDAKKSSDCFFTATCAKPSNWAHLSFFIVAIMIAGAFATIYTFKTLGYIPLFEMLKGGEASTLRGAATHMFGGNVYIRNIGMSLLVPLGNMLAFAQWRICKTRANLALFVLSGIVCVFCLTWDLEKAPLIYHFGYLYILACMLNARVSTRGLAGMIVSVVSLVALSYYLTSGQVPIELVNGPISRAIVTPVGAIGLHFHYFPVEHDYLAGASLPTIFARILGLPEAWVRSGRVVMTLFRPAEVASGVAGVMNAFFVGEAYANWGFTGVLFALLWVGTLIGVSQAIVLRGRKTMFSVMVMMTLIKFQMTSLMGGFVDYLYSPGLVISIAVVALATLPTARGASYTEMPS